MQWLRQDASVGSSVPLKRELAGALREHAVGARLRSSCGWTGNRPIDKQMCAFYKASLNGGAVRRAGQGPADGVSASVGFVPQRLGHQAPEWPHGVAPSALPIYPRCMFSSTLITFPICMCLKVRKNSLPLMASPQLYFGTIVIPGTSHRTRSLASQPDWYMLIVIGSERF